MKLLANFLHTNQSVYNASLEWHAEMVAKGWLTTEYHIYPEWSRFLAYSDSGVIVSFLIYERAANKSMIRIKGAWTHPDYRQQGLYGKLWRELVERYTGKYGMVRSGFHINNSVSQAMQISQGRRIEESISGNPDYRTTYYSLKNIEMEDAYG